MRGVGYTSPAVSADTGRLTVETLSLSGATIQYSAGSAPVVKGGVITVPAGTYVVSTSSPSRISTGETVVELASGMTVVLLVNDQRASVYNLFDTSSNSARVFVEGRHHLLVPVGGECTVSPAMVGAHQLTKDGIARRRVRMHRLQRHQVLTSEVSIISIMSEDKILRHVVSQDSGLKERLLKMAACVFASTGSHGPYGTQ